MSAFDREYATDIVGPNKNEDRLDTWQYNPQNSLVDYHFYNKSNDDPNRPTRLAPVIDGSVGKRNGNCVHTRDVYYDGTSTRNPDAMSNSEFYVTNSTASNAPPVTPGVAYTWPVGSGCN